MNEAERTIERALEPLASSGKAKPSLIVLQGESVGRIVHISGDRTVIGRGGGAHLILADPLASREHAEIVFRGESYVLRDLSSTNGSFVNGCRVSGERRLDDGDKITIGKHLLRFSLLDELELGAMLPSVRDKSTPTGNAHGSSHHVLCFPPFELPSAVDLLYRENVVIPLEPRAVRVLRYLAEHNERVVTKEELLEAVWPDVFTTDGVLKKAISLARRALSDDAKEAQFIETYHGRGYRFIASVQRRTD